MSLLDDILKAHQKQDVYNSNVHGYLIMAIVLISVASVIGWVVIACKIIHSR